MTKRTIRKNGSRLLSFILVSVLVSSFLTSCAFTGSLIFERLDTYLADYFKNFAEFSEEQENEINNFSQNYEEWVIKNHLKGLREIIVKTKSADRAEYAVLLREFDMGFRNFWKETNLFFVIPFTNFSESITDTQIEQIQSYFLKSFNERGSSDKRSKPEFIEEVQERYVKGFRRLGISLNKEQKKIINSAANNTHDILSDWRFNQEIWINNLIIILHQRAERSFARDLATHLQSQQDIGSDEYKRRIESNRDITMQSIIKIFENLTMNQRQSLNKKLDLYISIIDKVLLNSGEN